MEMGVRSSARLNLSLASLALRESRAVGGRGEPEGRMPMRDGAHITHWMEHLPDQVVARGCDDSRHEGRRGSPDRARGHTRAVTQEDERCAASWTEDRYKSKGHVT